MQNPLDVITVRMEEAKDWISDIENKTIENNETKKKKEKKTKRSWIYKLRELSNSTKHNTICITGVPQEETWEKVQVYLNKLYLRTSLI